MAQVAGLIKLLGELEEQLITCMRCGLCQGVCPVYAETGRETLVARGKIALLEGLAQELIRDPETVRQRLTTCLLCGACEANCPSGVKSQDIFLKARAILTGYLGLSPVKRVIFRGALARPKLFKALLRLAAVWQGVFTAPVNDVLGSSCARFSSPLGDRHFPRLADKSLLSLVGAMDTAAGESGLKVAFFPGCMVDAVFPEVGLAALKVLAHHGVGVFLADNLACCGIPALSSGDRPTFDHLVAINLDVLAERDVDALITPCATCTAVIKKIWPDMANDYPAHKQQQVAALAAKTMDINAFLVDRLGLTPPPAAPGDGAIKVTIHDPCHLKKTLGVAAQPRAVIRMNPQYSLVEMAESDACCGCGGSFALEHYDISAKIGRRKRDNIAASGAEVVAAGCPACMLQIMDALSHQGDRIR
ncbi:MAG: (Fe-S)-binding protein, partial [Deltaproteobacteria bacterium]|nr:(Fe-S)-binding protein [Deltaproteobacteria bacterium]